MLYMIGLGLGSSKDITLKGLELVKKADMVYLEQYTSLLCDEKDIKDLVRSLSTVRRSSSSKRTKQTLIDAD